MTLYELLRQTADNLAILKRFGWHENHRGLYDYCKDAEDYIRDKMYIYCADTLNKEIDITGESDEEDENKQMLCQ